MGSGLKDPVPKRAQRHVAHAEKELVEVRLEETKENRLLFGGNGESMPAAGAYCRPVGDPERSDTGRRGLFSFTFLSLHSCFTSNRSSSYLPFSVPPEHENPPRGR